MSSTRIYNHGVRCIYCQTEAKFVCIVDDTNPTTCPNNSGDIVTAGSAYEEYGVIGEDITGGSGIDVGCYNTVIARPSGATALTLSLPPISVVGDEAYMYFRADGATTTYLEPQSTDSINGGAAGATFALNTRISSTIKQVLFQTDSGTSDWTVVGGSTGTIGLDRDENQLVPSINLTQRGDARFTLRAKGDLMTTTGTDCSRLPGSTDGNLLSYNSSTSTGLEWITQGAADLLAYQFVYGVGPFTNTMTSAPTTPALFNAASWTNLAGVLITTPVTFVAGTYRITLSVESGTTNNARYVATQVIRDPPATTVAQQVLYYAPAPPNGTNIFAGSTRVEVVTGITAGVHTFQTQMIALGGGATQAVTAQEAYLEILRIA